MSSSSHCQLVRRHVRSYRRAPILRVRTGCLTCRGRKKKCDERKPVCTGCSRNHLTCCWPADRTQTRQGQAVHLHRDSNDGDAEQSLSVGGSISHLHSSDDCTASQGGANQELSPAAGQVSLFAPPEPCNIELRFPAEQPHEAERGCPEPHSTSPRGASSPRPTAAGQDLAGIPTHSPIEDTLGDTAQDRLFSALDIETPGLPGLLGQPGADLMLTAGTQSIPASPAFIPGLQTRSFQLLGHYVSCTALSMGNGSTNDNPFITQMVPLMFANNLILRLVLTQSAAHQAMASGASLDVAQRDYASALRIFQSAIGDYVNGYERSPLWVTIGALIMCFTEVRETVLPTNMTLTSCSMADY